MKIDMRNKWSLYNSGWNPGKMNVIIIHGFNGAESNKVMVILRNGNILYILFEISKLIIIKKYSELRFLEPRMT